MSGITAGVYSGNSRIRRRCWKGNMEQKRTLRLTNYKRGRRWCEAELRFFLFGDIQLAFFRGPADFVILI